MEEVRSWGARRMTPSRVKVIVACDNK